MDSPLALLTEESGQETNEVETSEFFGSSIVVVDDEEIMATIITAHLKQEGFYNIRSVTNPIDVVDNIKQALPDVVLMDLMMPDVSGKYLLHVFNSDQALRNIPVIVVSALTSCEAAEETFNLGATFFLEKPVIPEELRLRVHQSLAKKRLLDNLEKRADEEREQLRQSRIATCKSSEEQLRLLRRRERM